VLIINPLALIPPVVNMLLLIVLYVWQRRMAWGAFSRISRELDRADFCHAGRVSVWRRSIFGVGLYAAFPSALDVE
jgi:hypothetical protein